MPVAGALVDRWSRRVIMMVADGLIAIATVALALLFISGQVQIWHVYVLMFIRSAAGGFHWPAMQSSTSLMVPREHLARIQGLNQMLAGGMNIASAPLAALLLVVLPIQGVLAIDVFTALLAILPLFFIAVPQPAKLASAGAGAPQSNVWQDFRAGLRYVFAWPGLVMIGMMATVINFLLTPASALVPILVTRYFQGQAFHLAWMEAAWGIGVVAGGLCLSVWGGFRRQILTSLVGLMGIGLGGLLIGLVPAAYFPLAVLGMFILGFASPITNGPLMAVVQASVAPEMQGRVFTLIASTAAAMSPLGLLMAGPVADRFGVQTWFVIGGGITILMAVGALFVPAILHLEDTRKQDEKPDAAIHLLAASPVDGD